MKKILLTILLLCAIAALFVDRKFTAAKVMNYIAVTFIKITANSNEPEMIPLEVLNAHIYMRPDSIVSITEGWIPYYHRHERDGEINDVLLLLVKEGSFVPEYNQFFAFLLSKYPQHKKTLSSILPTLKPNEQEIIEKVLQDSNDFQVANFASPVEHEKIWAEYAITGDNDIVKKYIALLYATDETITQVTKKKVVDYLALKSKGYAKVYQLIQAAADFSPGDNSQLQTLASKLYKYIYKPANHYYYLGDNYLKNNQYDEALLAFRAGLFFAPDGPYLYRDIGSIYFSQKQYEKALFYYEQAKWTIHSQYLGYIYKQIGITYDLLGKDDLAHIAFKKAYSSKPDDDSILSHLAYSYAKRGDINGAVIYFKEMLSKSPSAEQVAYAKHFFKEYNIDYVITNQNLQYLLIQHQFQKLDEILTQTYREKVQDADGVYTWHIKIEELLPISWAEKETFEKFLAIHLEWVKQFPTSYYANASLGAFYVSYAWHARGVGYASTITPRARKLFHERLRLAEKYLSKAYTIDPSNPIAPYNMMIVANVHPDWQEEELETWFKRAIQAEPTDYKIYELRANFLAPKWGGSIEERFAFARDTFRNAPLDSMVPIVLAQAHWAIYDKSKDENYFKRPEVWSELKAVYTELVTRYPDSMKRHNWFAKTACLAGEFEVARAEFDIIGNRWDQSAWKTRESFDYHKQLAIEETL